MTIDPKFEIDDDLRRNWEYAQRDPIGYGYHKAKWDAERAAAAKQAEKARRKAEADSSAYMRLVGRGPARALARKEVDDAKVTRWEKAVAWLNKIKLAFIEQITWEFGVCRDFFQREDIQRFFKLLSFSVGVVFWTSLICDAWSFYNLNTGCHVQSLASMGCLNAANTDRYNLLTSAPDFLRCHAANDCPDGFSWATDSTILPWKIDLPHFLTDSIFGFLGYGLMFAWAILVDFWFYFWYVLNQPLAFNPPLIILLTGMIGGAVETARYAYAVNNPGALPEIFDSPVLFDPLNRVGRENALGEARFPTAAEASEGLKGKVKSPAPPPRFER